MEQKRDAKGRIIGGPPPAGFNKHPENISPGGWKKENTISYQYNRFMHMKEHELQQTVANEKQEKTWTVAMDIAFRRVVAAQKSLADVKEITDRTEGKSPQAIDLTSSDGSMTPTVIIEGIYANKPNFRPSNEAPEATSLAEDRSRESS